MTLLILKILSALLLLIGCGYLPLTWLMGKNRVSFFLRLGSAFLVGSLCASLWIFAILLCGCRGIWFMLLPLVAVSLPGLIILIRDFRTALRKGAMPGMKDWLLIGLIFIQLAVLVIHVFSRPTAAYDSVAIWSFIPKVLSQTYDLNFYPEDFLHLFSGWHMNYPMLVQGNLLLFSRIFGGFADTAINMLFVSFWLAILCMLYGALRETAKRTYILMTLFIFSSIPLAFYHGYNAYADLPLSAFVLGAFIFLIHYIKKGYEDYRLLFVSALLLGGAFFVKLDALIFIVSLIAGLALSYSLAGIPRSKILRGLGTYSTLVFLVALPWLGTIVYFNLGLSNMSPGLGFHPQIWKHFVDTLFLSGSWNIFWYLVLATLFLNFKKISLEQSLLSGWIILALIFTGYLALYSFTEEYQFVINRTATSRNMLAYVPIALYISSLTLFLDKDKSASRI